ncbi:MAG: hypothetical protein ACI9R3_005213 [Verrucomicrobiales bacterium]|jgi:hypothetical protein
MAGKIHLFVENAHHINTSIHDAVKDHMMPYPVPAVSFPDVVTRSTAFWIKSKLNEIIVDHPHVSFGLFFSPNIDGVIPNLFKVCDRLGSKKKLCHLPTLSGRDESINIKRHWPAALLSFDQGSA